MSRRFTLGKDQRLKSRKQIERVFREGKSFNLFPYRVYYMLESPSSGSGGAAVGAAVVRATQSGAAQPVRAGRFVRTEQPVQAGFGASSRHFKKAVDRNRIKRLTREAYRLQKTPLCQLIQERELVLSLFFIYTGKELPDHQLVSGKIAVALEKIVKEIGS